MKKLVLFLMLLMPLAFVQCQNTTDSDKTTNTIESVSPVLEILDVDAFKAKTQMDGVQLIDVRTPKEFGEGHINGATNINLFDEDFKAQVGDQLDPNKPLLVYCRAGSRSARAIKIIQELGFKEIYDLKGGFLAWDAAQKKE